MIQLIPLALLLGAAMAVAWYVSRRRSFLILALIWLAYAGYEYLMYARVLCTGECNIRVDLLLIYPVLFVSTLRVGWPAVIREIKRRRNSA